MTFFHQYWLYIGAVAVVLAVAVSVWSYRTRADMLAKFVSAKLINLLSSSASRGRIILKQALVVAGIAALFVALARPQYGYIWQEAKSRGIDIVFAIDTSKSMLAKDVRPDRLTRAKLAITDLLGKLKGDRIGLVAFSGQAFLQCPMTLDYHAFEMSLDAINTRIIQRGGTNISAAIKEAESAFAGTTNHKIIILISDGEELEDEAVSTAKAAAGRGVKIFTLGVGSASGEPVPVADEYGNISYVKDENGRVITSRLNEKTLKEIASATGGFYENLSADGMEKIYEDGLKSIPQQELSAKMKHMAIERFQIPLALALILLALETLIGTRKLFAKRARAKAARNAMLGMLALCLTVLPQISRGQTVSDTSSGVQSAPKAIVQPSEEVGNTSAENVQKEEKSEAAEKFEPDADSTPREVFNAAVDAQAYGDLAHARKLYAHAVKISDDLKLHAKAYFNTAIADYKDAKNAYEKIASISEFQKNASQAQAANMACINGGMAILQEAVPLLKEEKEFLKNNPNKNDEPKAAKQQSAENDAIGPKQEGQARPKIESDEFQQKVKQAISQCEAAKKASDDAKAQNESISAGAKNVDELLDKSIRNFESAKTLDSELPQTDQSLKNVRGVKNSLKASLSKNNDIVSMLDKSSETLSKIIEELKKLLRDKQDNNQNQDNQNNQQNQNQQNNQQDQNNQNQQNNQQNQDQQNQQNNQNNQQNQNSNQDQQNQQQNNQNQQNQDQKDSQNKENQDKQQNKDNQNSQQNQNNEQSGKDNQNGNNQENKNNNQKEDQADKDKSKQSDENKDKSGQEQNKQNADKDKSEPQGQDNQDKKDQSGQSSEQQPKKDSSETESAGSQKGPQEQAVDSADKKEDKKAASEGKEEQAADKKEQELAAANASEEKKDSEEEQKGVAPGEETGGAIDENYRSAEGVMTRREAVQMLNSLKADEKRLPFKGYGDVQDRYEEKSYKDW